LALIAPAGIWILALLASLLTLDQIFKNDYDDGSVESYVLTSYPLELSVLAKVLAHWLLSGLPLVIFAPVIGLLLHLPKESYGILILSLLLGTPIFSLLGSIGSALTMSLKHGGLLLTVLVMPLLAPVLIFGAGAVVETSFGNSANSHLLFLGGLLFLALTLVPFASAAAIKINLE
jgi:heme exporter protein B